MITLLLKQQTTTARTNAFDKSHANGGNSRFNNESTVHSRQLHLIANSNLALIRAKTRFPLYFRHTFPVTLPPVTRTLDNSNRPRALTRSNFGFPTGDSQYIITHDNSNHVVSRCITKNRQWNCSPKHLIDFTGAS